MDTVKLLQALTKIPVVSGFEMKSGIHQELMKLLSKYNPTVDSMGNVVVKIGSGKKNILVEAHMDEVGFIKTSNGFAVVGSINETQIQEENISFSEESKIAYFKRRFEQNGDIVKSPALDNKTGCSALILSLEKLSKIDAEIHVAFTVREETSKDGILLVVNRINPEIVVSIDSAYAKPYHNENWDIPECGKGPAIQMQGRDFSISDYELIEKVAKKNKIHYQFEIVDSEHGGTNLGALVGVDIGRFQINIPVRYQHTALSETSLSDIENASKLICAFVKETSLEQ